MLHRDVKPQNVLLDLDGNAYLTDFGLARPLERRDGTSADELEGTLLYLAPERIDGRAASPASDEYALACLAYLLLAGETPFSRSHEAAVLYAHLRDEVPSLAGLGLARIDAVLRKGLAKQPEDRYPSCDEFVRALGGALAAREPAGVDWPDSLPRPRTSFLGRERELDEPARAARLLSAAERLSASFGSTWQGREAERRDEAKTRLFEILGDGLGKTWADAELIPMEDVIAEESRQSVVDRV